VIRRHGSKAVVVATCQLSVKALPLFLAFFNTFASYDDGFLVSNTSSSLTERDGLRPVRQRYNSRPAARA
jgi:hypothetical protein